MQGSSRGRDSYASCSSSSRVDACAFEISASSGAKQQHMSRRLSYRVSVQASNPNPESSSWSLPSLPTCKCGLGPPGCRERASSMLLEFRGVTALPNLSVCVIRSGRGSPSEATFKFCAPGVLRCPGDLKSLEPRVPAGVALPSGVAAAVSGVCVPSASASCCVSTCRDFLELLRLLRVDDSVPPFVVFLEVRDDILPCASGATLLDRRCLLDCAAERVATSD